MPPPYKLNPLYTPDFMAGLRQAYTETHEPMWSIAARHGIATRTFEKIVDREGWPKRRERVREVVPAQHLLAEAQALLAAQMVEQEPGSGEAAPPAPEAAPSPPPDPAERIEKLLIREVEIEEARHAKLAGLPRPTAEAARTARTLAVLTQTLHALRRLRHGEQAGRAPTQEEKPIHDDIPDDLDEFRRELARRIDAFVASRTDAGDAGGDPDAVVDRA